MKKYLILFSCLFAFSSMNAQKGFQLGLKLSPNVGWIKPDATGYSNEGSQLGFNYGLISDFNITETYAFSTGIELVTIRGKVKSPAVSSNGTSLISGTSITEFNMKYVEIPLTLKLRTKQIGYLTYYGSFGFNVGVNYDASADVEFTDPNGTGTALTEDQDISDDVNLIRLALNVGLGVEYNLSGNTSLIGGISFNNGFTNVFDQKALEVNNDGSAQLDANGETVDGDDLKAVNNYVVLNVGILF